ncbi:MAG: pre-mRNA processing factor 3-domain-containing protein [Olpidium bornovanus]|uniref:Pre-mRNA processing factor 3-domain-containing protein n=1 Tax=Olpidium bornovanus TaxID=278681 RepID=A0A8H7ZR28_9FUNG|nr:MAG: pre-mRNA processing factor 3-domain-containing protein [Olpidium bornovanus]
MEADALDGGGYLEKQIRRNPPPAVEWWDALLLPSGSYDDLDTMTVGDRGGALEKKIDEMCLDLVQHPVPVHPPYEDAPPPARALMLTTKERKKLRRQRRAEEQKERQDKVRLGLLPPEEPKVRLANLMRVLGQEAVLDPTKIEAKVRRQVEERRLNHLRQGVESKLTPEQKKAKAKRKYEASEDKGVTRFKVDKNATQYQLTGCSLLCPNFSMVVVEGGPKGIRHYKKLMLRRIDWEEENIDEEQEGEQGGRGGGGGGGAGGPGGGGGGGNAGGDAGQGAKDKEPNACHLVWEGEVTRRAFVGFRFRQCPTERSAREHLARSGVEYFFDYVKNYVPAEGEASVGVAL